MRWPWRRRARGGRVVFIGTSPFDVRAAIDAVPTPSPVVAAWIPDEPAEPAESPTPPLSPAPPAPAAAAPAAPTERPGALATEPADRTAPENAPFVPVPPAPAAAERQGVQLGFADGTVITLGEDDPRAVALRAAAARLTSTS